MAGIFAPPRNKPKISRPMPTLAAGQPMPQVQTIDRPVNLVDDMGNVHGRLGENGQEQVRVTPSGLPTNDPAGGPNYASGGTLLIGGTGRPQPKPVLPGEYPNDGGWGQQPPQDNYSSTIGTGIFGGGGVQGIPGYQPQQQQSQNSYPSTIGTGMFGQQQPAPSITSVPLQTMYGNPNQNIWQAQQNQTQAKNQYLDMKAKVLDAKTGTMPLQNNVLQAKWGVNFAQSQQNQMQKGYLQQEQGNQQLKAGELQAIYAASKNTPDLLNAGEAQNAYASENRRDSAMGVSAPAEVNLPSEYNGPRQAGIRPKIMTQEQRLAEKAGYEDPIRNQQLQIAQTIVQLQGTDVRAAELAAAKAGLTLDQANQLVSQAELGSEYAGIVENRAGLGVQEAGQPPFAGAVKWTDPATGAGRWVTPQQYDQLQAQYQENVQQPYATSVRNQGSNLAGLSDAQLANTLPDDANYFQQYQVFQELIRRYTQQGMTPEAATQKAQAVIQQEIAGRKSGQKPLTSAPAGTPPPASAPLGTATGPVLPPGYIP